MHTYINTTPPALYSPIVYTFFLFAIYDRTWTIYVYTILCIFKPRAKGLYILYARLLAVDDKNILMAVFAKQLPVLIADIFHRNIINGFHHNFPVCVCCRCTWLFVAYDVYTATSSYNVQRQSDPSKQFGVDFRIY